VSRARPLTVVWTDGDRLGQHRAKAYKVEPVPNNPVSKSPGGLRHILFEEGSIAHMTASLIGNVFSF